METFLGNLRAWGSKIQETWQKLALNQKILIAGAALMVVVAIIFLVRGTKTQYEVLYTELDPKDAAAVVAKLDEYKTSYQLADNGTTILVSPTDKYSTRIKLAGENLPSSESGFELFQQNNYGETQTDKKVKYQVALQGELARTIQSLQKVKSARVHLVMPEETLFSDKEQAPSASVAITTKDGETLNAREVQGIINLVANSVEGLTPEKVVIVDHYGNLISQDLPADGTNTDTLQTQLAMKRAFEQEKQQAIQSMLDQTLGKNNAVVRVSAELNFNNKQEKTEQYTHDPEGQFVRSEHIIKESGTSTPTNNEQGVPGTDTNITQYTESGSAGSVSTTDKSDKTRNFELNRTDTVIDYATGETKYDYLTVTVLVNNAASSKSKLGNTEEEKTETIRKIAATACGLRENRENEMVKLDDNISVAFIDFNTEPLEETDSQGVQKWLSSPLFPYIMALLVLTIGLLLWLLLRRKNETEKELEFSPGFEAIAQEELSLAELMEQNLTPEEREHQRVRNEIDKVIKENPDSAVQVLRTWLLEDQR